jgi:hypothetical protein
VAVISQPDGAAGGLRDVGVELLLALQAIEPVDSVEVKVFVTAAIIDAVMYAVASACALGAALAVAPIKKAR